MVFRPTTFRLKNKVVLNIVLAAVILELISALQFFHTHQLLADELELRAESELNVKVIVIKNALNISENYLWGHLWDLERNITKPDSLFDVMEWVLKYHKNLTGCWTAFVPNYFPDKGRLYEPYAYWDHDTIVKRQIASEDHNYLQSPYYNKVISTNATLWFDPYYDDITGINMVSYCMPIQDHKGNVVAAFGVDVSTKMLGDTLNHGQIYESSFDLLLTKEGKLVAGPDSTRVKHNDVNHVISIINDSTVTKQTSKRGKCKIATFTDPEDNEKGYIYYTSFKGKPDWQIAVVCYDDEVFGPLRQMHLTILMTTLAGLIILGFIISYFIRNNTKLEDTKKEKERIDSELHIANNIQMQMLPKQMPAERDDIDIHGFLLPAREVGGDLYDYFVRDEKLFFCIGDVSGKGVPAAILMAVIHTWVRAISTHQSNPANIMRTINEAACEGNESNMFVTLFIGILDLPTGRLCYCNAGHDAPVVLNEEFATALPVKPNLPIGIFDDFHYDMQETTIESGSTLFLYTDGLTEAKNKHHKLFGVNRVMSILTTSADQSPKQLLDTMSHEVKVFTDGTEQSDDLTMLVIRYTPKQFESTLTETLVLKNDVHEVTRFSSFIKSVIEELNIDKSLGHQLRLAVEEAVVNVINYAYPTGTEGDITVKITSDGHILHCQIIDAGIPFDPTAQEKTDISLPTQDRPVGGLGFLLVRELMDSINYERIDGKNVLTLKKSLELRV